MAPSWLAITALRIFPTPFPLRHKGLRDDGRAQPAQTCSGCSPKTPNMGYLGIWGHIGGYGFTLPPLSDLGC
jgi:hypothetical protein